MWEKIKKRKKMLILIFNAVLLLTLLLVFVLAGDGEVLDIPLSSWQSGYGTYNGDGWYVDRNMMGGKSNVYVLYGPYCELESGTYKAVIRYETDYDRTVNANSNDSEKILAPNGILRAQDTSAEFEFELTRGADDFELRIAHNGQGYLEISSIEIFKSNWGTRRTCLIIGLVLAFAELLIYGIVQRKKRILCFLGAFAIGVASVLPILVWGNNQGHDFRFHLLRLESIAEGLENGQFPVKMNSSAANGYGYPTGIYYGDILLYVPAVLRLMGVPLLTSYSIFVFLIGLCTAIISYVCFGKIFKSDKIGLVASLLYTLAAYRLENVYVRIAVGEYCSMMFLPIVALAVYRIYTEDTADFKKYRKNSLTLAVGMSGLVLTHVLTVEMAVLALALVCLVMAKKTFKKNTLLVYLKAVLETVGICLFFVVPFLDYYINVDVSINEIVSGASKKIGGAGITLKQFFTFFNNIPQSSPYMFLTVGIPLLLVLVGAAVLIGWKTRKKNKAILIYFGFSLIYIFMSTQYFPWNILSETFVGNLIAQIQFPWRFLGLASLFLVLLMGECLKHLSIEKGMESVRAAAYAVILTSSIVCHLAFVGNYAQNGYLEQNHYGSGSVGLYSFGFQEYVLTDCNVYDTDGEIDADYTVKVEVTKRTGSNFELYCQSADKAGYVQLPLFNYKGYVAVDENGNELEIYDGENRTVRFDIPANYEGTVSVEFVEPWYWRGAEIISLLFVSALITVHIPIKGKRIGRILEEKLKRKKI